MVLWQSQAIEAHNRASTFEAQYEAARAELERLRLQLPNSSPHESTAKTTIQMQLTRLRQRQEAASPNDTTSKAILQELDILLSAVPDIFDRELESWKAQEFDRITELTAHLCELAYILDCDHTSSPVATVELGESWATLNKQANSIKSHAHRVEQKRFLELQEKSNRPVIGVEVVQVISLGGGGPLHITIEEPFRETEAVR